MVGFTGPLEVACCAGLWACMCKSPQDGSVPWWMEKLYYCYFCYRYYYSCSCCYHVWE